MEDGLLSLKWNNHKTTFFDILRVLREKSTYTDATLAVEGKFYQVHKLVMSTCSEYFSEIFERTPCKSPVIVLKDVRSQDLEALLDYMYLGEVNVNQNDLALLLKTAECLRIKGLAVPDEDPASKHRKGPDERLRESPPPKRRRHTVPQSAPVSDDANRAPSPANSKSSNTSSSNAPSNAATQPSQHTVSLDHNQQDIASEPPPPMVKVEMEEAEDNDDSYMHDNNYDGSGGGGGGSEGDGHRDFPDIEKAEHDIAGYGSNTYPAGPSVQGGELPWDEGDSSSFPPESFSGDVPGSQTQGGRYSGVSKTHYARSAAGLVAPAGPTDYFSDEMLNSSLAPKTSGGSDFRQPQGSFSSSAIGRFSSSGNSGSSLSSVDIGPFLSSSMSQLISPISDTSHSSGSRLHQSFGRQTSSSSILTSISNQMTMPKCLRRPYRHLDPTILHEAVQAIREGRMSGHQAARHYQIPRSTLTRWVVRIAAGEDPYSVFPVSSNSTTPSTSTSHATAAKGSAVVSHSTYSHTVTGASSSESHSAATHPVNTVLADNTGAAASITHNT